MKPKLAREVGNDQAVRVYRRLLQYTKGITKPLNSHKLVYYSDYIDNNDLWDNMLFEKHLQDGVDMGERMENAFADAFSRGQQKVIVIASDCVELETYMIKEAFAVLDSNDVVLGPARDGGYYLIGMKKFFPTLFEDKDWDTTDVLMDTILDLKKMNAQYYLLKTLSDLDSAADLGLLAKLPEEKSEDWF